MGIELRPIAEADPASMQKILNDPRVRKHMPLADEQYSVEWVADWLAAKSRSWPHADMGPWAVYMEDQLVGWAGVQPHEPDAHDLAIVLASDQWGAGPEVLSAVMNRWRSFNIPGVVLAFLPSTRRVDLLARRLGWRTIGATTIEGQQFTTLVVWNDNPDS